MAASANLRETHGPNGRIAISDGFEFWMKARQGWMGKVEKVGGGGQRNRSPVE